MNEQNDGSTRKAASQLKGRTSVKTEDELLKEATLALKSACAQPSMPLMREETDQDMIYGKWLGGELKQITDSKTKQLVKMKIQNILFEAQFGESVIDKPTQNFGPTNSFCQEGSSNSSVVQQGPGNFSTNFNPQPASWQTQNSNTGGFQMTYTNL